MPKIAVLHTSLVFVSVDSVVNDLLAELAPGARVLHFVDSDVLSTVIRDGSVTESSTSRMVHLAQAAEQAGADIILSACSSLGPGVDVAAAQVGVPVVKIDQMMARRAAEAADRIGVLATVPSTLGPTTALLHTAARAAGRQVDVEPALVDGAFEVLMSGDRERHDDMLVGAAQELAERVELIVLAQASMWRMVDRLEHATGRTVLSSPRLGVEDVAARLSDLARG